MIDAGILEPMGLRESDWCSHIFLVLKNDGAIVGVVTDIKAVSRYVKQPTHPTDSSNQLLQQKRPTSKFFATLDCTSGYHQIAADDASSDLLVIATPSGRCRMKVRDICQ